LRPNTASVLVYINQSTTTADNPEPMLTASSVVVTMSKVDGKWLISAFNPNAA
jgi:Mce-associated membrane protein